MDIFDTDLDLTETGIVIVQPVQANGHVVSYKYNLTKASEAEPYSSQAIVERFLNRFGQYICKTQKNDFLCFDERDKVWKKQSLRDYTVIKSFLNVIIDELIFSQDFVGRYGYNAQGEFSLEKLTSAREKLRSIKNTRSYVEALLNDPNVVIKHSYDFDKEEKLFAVNENIVNLSTGEIRAIEATDYVATKGDFKFKDCEVVNSYTCPRWEKFLEEIFESNDEPEEMIKALQEIFGYSLSGDMDQQVIFCHFGSGANGKSTVLRVLRKLTGRYGAKLSPDLLSKKNMLQFERIAAKLQGLRCAIIDDIESTYHWNEAFVKNVTDIEIESRELYSESGNIQNTAKIHLGVNEMPVPETSSHGFFRRIRIINYHQVFEPNSAKSRELKEMMEEEIGEIFKWSIMGYRRYLEQGFMTTPKETIHSQNEYRDEFDLEDQMVVDIFDKTEKEDMDFLPVKVVTDILNRVCKEKEMQPYFTRYNIGIKIKKIFKIKAFQKKIGNDAINTKVYQLKLKDNYKQYLEAQKTSIF